jgi:hypothetical protein
MKIKPVGSVKEPIKIEKPKEITAEYIASLTLHEAIPYLRNLTKEVNDTFPWLLVERHLQDADAREITPSPLDEVPVPQNGYKWYWISNRANLSGMSGWLEVDEANKRQGRFILVCMH